MLVVIVSLLEVGFGSKCLTWDKVFHFVNCSKWALSQRVLLLVAVTKPSNETEKFNNIEEFKCLINSMIINCDCHSFAPLHQDNRNTIVTFCLLFYNAHSHVHSEFDVTFREWVRFLFILYYFFSQLF